MIRSTPSVGPKIFALDHYEHGIQLRHWGSEPLPRYVRQASQTCCCGPVGLANTFKSLGYEFSYKEYRREFEKSLKYTKRVGVWSNDVTNGLRSYGFKVRYRYEGSFELIDENISKGPIIVSYAHSKEAENSHMAVVVDKRTWEGVDYYGIVNAKLLDDDVSLEYVRKNLIKRFISLEVWLIREP